MAKQLNVNLAFTADTSQAAAQVRNLQTQLTNLINQPVGIGTKMTAEIQSAVSAAAELKAHLQNATNVKTGTLDFGRLNQSLKASGTSLSQYAAKLQSIGPQGQQAFMSLARSVANAEVPLRRSNALLQQFGTTLANTARWQLSSSLLHGFISSVSTAWRYSQDLNESLNNIRIVTGKNIDEMSRFADQANRAAKALSTTTTEYTNASLIYYQQGLSDAEVFGRTETTIKMANASRQSAEIVSDQMTAIWNNFYDGSKSLEYYADVVTALGAATASSSEEIATGLEKFAAVAETVGLSYEYATSALATITATTRQSADIVGTALKTLFARLSDLKLGETLEDGTTLGQYSENLAKVGVNIKDASGQLKDMDTILNETAAKWDTLDRAQQTALAKSVAGIRQYTQFIALMDNWDFMEKNLATASGSSGTLQKQADIYAESWEAARDRVTASLEVIYESIMDDEFFIDLTKGFAGLIDGVGGFVKSIGGLQGVLSGLGFILTKVFADQMAQGFQNLTYNIQMATQAGREYVQAQKIEQVQQFVNSMKTFGSPDGDPTGIGTTMRTVYTEELTMQQQLMQNADRLTQAEQQKLQSLIEQHRVMGDQAIAMAQQLEQSRDLAATLKIELMGHGMQFWGQDQFNVINQEFTRLGGQAEGIGKISAQLKGLGQNADITEDQVKTLVTQFSTLSLGTPTIVNLAKSLQGLNGNSTEAKAIFEELNVEMQKVITSSTNSLATMAGIDKNTEGYERLRQKVEQYVVSCQNAGNKQELLEILMGNGAAAAEQFGQSVYNAGQKIQTTAQLLSTAVSGLMSAGMLVSSINGLMDTLSNPDLSGWEKFGMILTSVSMITFSLTGAWKGLTSVIEVGRRILTTDTAAVTANAWAKELVAKKEERLAAAKAKGTIIQRIKSALNKGEIADDIKDTATTNAAAAAQEGENAKIRENIALELARKKMGLRQETGLDGKIRHYRQGKDGSWIRLRDKQYNNLLQQGRAGITDADIDANMPQTPAGKTKLDKGTLSTIGKTLGSYVLIAAAIAAAAYAIKTASDYYNRFEIAAQKARETADALNTSYEEVKSSATEFRDTISKYNEGVAGLDELTKGTKEYEEAIRNANESALTLLKTYKNLKYEINEEGLIEIDKGSLFAAQQESLEREARAFAAAQAAEQAYDNARLEADKVNFQRTQAEAGGRSWDADDTAAVGGGLGAGAALGAGAIIAFANAWNPVGWAMIIAGALAAVVGTGIAAFNNDADIREAQTLDALAEFSKANNNSELTPDQIKKYADMYDNTGKLSESLLQDVNATNDMIAKMVANTEAIERNNDLIASQLLETNKYISGSKYASQVKDISGEIFGREYEKALEYIKTSGWGKVGIAQIDGANAEAERVWKEYSEIMGTNFELVDTTGNDDNRKFVYLDEGQRKEITLEQMQIDKATAIAQQNVNNLAIQLTDLISNWDEEHNEQQDEALLSFLSNKDFSAATYAEFLALKDDMSGKTAEDYLSSKFGDLEELAAKMGFDSAKSLIAAFEGAIKGATISWDSISVNADTKASSSLSGAQTIENLTAKMNGGVLAGSGDAFEAGLNKLLEGATESQKKQFYSELEKLNWDEFNTASKIPDILHDIGLELNMTTEEFDAYRQMINIATGATFDYEQALKDMKAIAEATKDLSVGSIITEEQYNLLVKYNAELSKYFRLLGDGSAMMIGDKLDLQQEVKKTTYDMYKDNIEGAKANLAKGIKRGEVDDAIEKTGLTREQLTTIGGQEKKVIDKEGTEANGWEIAAGILEMVGGTAMATVSTGATPFTAGTSAVGIAAGAGFMADGAARFNRGLGTKEESHMEWEQNTELIDKQLQFLRDTGEYTAQAIADLGDGSTKESAAKIAEAVQSYMDKYPALTQEELDALYKKSLSAEIDYALTATSAEKRQAMLDKGEIQQEAYNAAQFQAIQQEKWENIDATEVENYAEHLQQAAEASELLDNNLKENEEAAEDVALYTIKMNKGIDKLIEGFEDWNSILKKSDKSSEEYNKAMADMKDAMSDVLGVEEEFLSDKFILENLEKIEKAAKGDAEAIDELAIAAGQQILIDISMGNESLEQDLLDLQKNLLYAVPEDIKVGAKLETSNFIDAANDLVEEAGMSVEQAQAYFNSLGYEPEFVMDEKTVMRSVPQERTHTDYVITKGYVDIMGSQVPIPTIDRITSTVVSGYKDMEEKIQVPAMSADGKTPKIKSLTKKSSGSMSNYSSSNKGGKSPSGGGGGGGGSKKKTKNDEIERYHKINKTLDYLKSSYDAIGKARERAFGQDKLNYLQQEQAILEQQLETQRQYLQEIEAYYQKDRSALAEYGGIFNEQGILTNYDALMESYLDKFNTGKIDEEAYNAFKEAISQYEETWQKWIDQSAAVVDAENTLLDKKLETVQAKVDLNISLTEDQLEWLEYQLENIEDAAYGAAEALALMVQQASQLMTQSSTYQEGIAELLGNHGITDTEAFFSNPDSWSQYNFTEAEIEKLRDYRSNLMSVNKELMGLKDEAISQVTSAFDEWNTKIDENIEKLEHNASILESFKNIVDLVGKDTLGMADEAINALAQASIDTATKQLKASRAKYEQSKQAVDEVREKMAGLDPESEEYKMLAETLKHIEKETAAAEEEMMSSWESALEAAADAFETAVDNTISSFEKAMAGTFGSLEELQGAFDQSTEISERYVADYKEIYELSKLNRDIMKSMDETDNIKAKRMLRDLQEEINELQESNVQMSEYDLEYLRAKYELRLAEIALEEAQNAKSQVRMRRDSEGNYSYVFTADESKVAEAQQNYEDKLYEMQELNSEYIKEMQSNILQSEIELANALRELDKTKFASDEEYYAKVNELTNYYTGQRNYYLDETNKGLLNNKELVESDWANYSAATGYKISADSDYVDSFNETTYAQVAGYNTIQEAQDRFAEATRVMVTDLQTAFTQWQANVDSAMAAAGISVDQFAEQVDDTINNEENGILANNEALIESVQGIGEEMTEIFSEETLNGLSTFADKYASTIKPMIDANNELIQSLNTLIAAQASQTNVGTDPGDTPVDVPGDSDSSGSDASGSESDTESGNDDDKKDELPTKYKYSYLHNGTTYGNYSEAMGAAKAARQAHPGVDGMKIVYVAYNDQNALLWKQDKGTVKDYLGAYLNKTFGATSPEKKTVKQLGFQSMDTGGYTGSWGPDGRLAMLHQKELVLNAEDTKNILGAVDMIRSISHIIDLNAGAQSLGFARLDATRVMGEAEVIKQDVSIYAEFPNAVDHSEIEMAFHNLMNQASQFANRPKI